MGDALDGLLRGTKDQRSHDEYADRMRLHVRPVLDSTLVVKITKLKLLELRSDVRERDGRCLRRPSTACSRPLRGVNYFIEQGWCSDAIRNLVAVLVGTGLRLNDALHLIWTGIDLQHRVIHAHRGAARTRDDPQPYIVPPGTRARPRLAQQAVSVACAPLSR